MTPAPSPSAPVQPTVTRFPANPGYAADLPAPNATYSRAPSPQPMAPQPTQPYRQPLAQTYVPPPPPPRSAGEPMRLNSHAIY